MLNILMALSSLTRNPSFNPIKKRGINAMASIIAGSVKIYHIFPLNPLNFSIWSTATNLQRYSIRKIIPKNNLAELNK